MTRREADAAREGLAQEVRSTLATLATYRQAPEPTGRTWAWVARAAIILLLASGLLYQYLSSQALHDALYRSCQTNNAAKAQQRAAYLALAQGVVQPTGGKIVSPSQAYLVNVLNTAASRVMDSDCDALR